MATYSERAQAYANAFVNRTATVAEINRIGAAIAFHAGNSTYYAGLTNAQKAEYFVRWVRDNWIGIVKAADMQTAAANAQNQAATDLPETP